MSQLPSDPSRRTFLKSSSMLATGSLLVGFELPYGLASAPKSSGAASLMTDAFIRIDRDNTITVLMNHAEFGNGVYTSLAMMVAEELDIDWQLLKEQLLLSDKDTQQPTLAALIECFDYNHNDYD